MTLLTSGLVSRLPRWPLALVGALLLCEAVLLWVNTVGGLLLYGVVLVGLAAGASRTPAPIWSGLMVIPLLRLVGYGLPLGSVPVYLWHWLVGSVLIVALASLRLAGSVTTRDPVTPAAQQWLWVGAVVIGVVFGIGQYVILRPLLPAFAAPWELMLYAAGVLIFAGGLETVVFFGWLQPRLTPAFSPNWATGVTVVLFAVLQLGVGGWAWVAVSALKALMLGTLEQRGWNARSLSIAGGVASLLTFAVLPLVFGR